MLELKNTEINITIIKSFNYRVLNFLKLEISKGGFQIQKFIVIS